MAISTCVFRQAYFPQQPFFKDFAFRALHAQSFYFRASLSTRCLVDASRRYLHVARGENITAKRKRYRAAQKETSGDAAGTRTPRRSPGPIGARLRYIFSPSKKISPSQPSRDVHAPKRKRDGGVPQDPFAGGRRRFGKMSTRKVEANTVGVRTKFHFQFITTPTSDTPGTALLLHFDKKRYIFGELTEGTQRACIQRGIGLKKVRGLFLSGKTHWNNGGLIGMILTMAGVQESELDETERKRPRLDIHAGPKQLQTLACARRFVFRTGMPLLVHEVDVRRHSVTKPIHEDENIRVWAIPTRDGAPEETNVTIDDSSLGTTQSLRKEIVNNMFDSDWRRDRLFESKLKDVKLPSMVFVRDPETKTLIPQAIVDIEKTTLRPDDDVLHRNPWPASAVEELPPATDLPHNTAMSYIVKGHPQRGTFDVARAKAAGVKPGPKYAMLAAGQAVVSDDGLGNHVTPDMVLSPTRPSKGIALFDMPSAGHLVELARQLTDRATGLLEGIEAAVWMTRGEVLRTEVMETLLNQLTHMKHFISDTSLCRDNLTNDSSALSAGRLAQIAPSLFPIPRFNNVHGYAPLIMKSDAEVSYMFDLPQVLPARRGLRVEVEPALHIDESEIPEDLDAGSFATGMESPIEELLPRDTALYDAPAQAFILGADLEEPEIITLGTGSAAPSKYRNVSAILLRMPKGMGNYLFDCGEGTLGQLKRLYNSDQLDEILSNLRAVWISHLHADHHLGTVSVLKAAHKIVRNLSSDGRPRPSPPYLLSEINMVDYVNEYQSVLGLSTEELCTPVPCDPFRRLSYNGKPFDIGREDPHIQEWRTAKVSHCHGAQAVSVTFKNGFKFSYSGDCRPSESFCEVGADSDVLVHEATFDDGMEGDARAKKHSTTGEAVGVALAMRAKHLVLTHFSQRYQKIPVINNVKIPERVSEEDLLDEDDTGMTNDIAAPHADDESLDTHQPLAPTPSTTSWIEPDVTRELPIAVAFDLMRIKISQIKHMKALFPAISKMFELEEQKRERTRQDAAAQVQAEEERKRTARTEAQDKKKEKLALQNKQQQTEAAGKNKSKRNKRKAGGADDVDHVVQTQTRSNGAKSEDTPIPARERESINRSHSGEDRMNGADQKADDKTTEGMEVESPIKRRRTDEVE